MILFLVLHLRVLVRELHPWQLDYFDVVVQTLLRQDVLQGVGLGERGRDGQGQFADSTALHSVSPSEREMNDRWQ
jgi:hypothetical protein